MWKQFDRLAELHIGIDDTDSRLGGCTTYTAAVIFEKLIARGFVPNDFPWLVRLNPNIPWKTRGNGALALHFLVDPSRIHEAKQLALNEVRKTDFSIPSTDPAVVFFQGNVPLELLEFSETALHDVVRVKDAKTTAEQVKADVHLLKGSRGLVGALAAVGANLQRDHTYEIVAYRTKEYLGTPRRIDKSSVKDLDARFCGTTFNNVDPETGRVLISPHGPDPVLFGIRGEDPLSLAEAFRYVKVEEPIDRVMIFKTNHGTDAHLTTRRTVSEIQPYQSVIVVGKVKTRPRVLQGGHVVFSLTDDTGRIDCAAFEPTGPFRKVVKELYPGDQLKAFGGVRQGPGNRLTLNLEKIEVVKLVDIVHYEKPRCSRCNRRCETMGKGQGFRCRKCGLRYPRESLKAVVRQRNIEETVYIPPPRANRHLTKPASRYKVGKTGKDYGFASFADVSSLESLLRTVQPPLPL